MNADRNDIAREVEILNNGAVDNQIVAATNLREIARNEGGLDDPPALSALTVALDSSDENLARTAAEALGASRTDVAKRTLLEIAGRKNMRKWLLVGVATGLGYWNDNETLKALNVLMGYNDAEVRAAAIESLFFIGTNEAYDRLATHLGKEQDIPLKIRIIEEFSNDAEALRHQGVIQPISEYLQAKDSRLALPAAEFLARIGRDDGIHTLIGFLDNEDESLVGRADRTIRQISQDPDVLELLDRLPLMTDDRQKRPAYEELRIRLARDASKGPTPAPAKNLARQNPDIPAEDLDRMLETIENIKVDNDEEDLSDSTDAARGADGLEQLESQVLEGLRGDVYALTALADGRLASGSRRETIHIWDLSSGENQVLEGRGGAVYDLAVLGDGRLAAGSKDGNIRIWDLSSGENQVLEGHSDTVHALAVLGDGRLASGSEDSTIRIWNLESGESQVLEGHSDAVYSLAVLEDGRLASGSYEKAIRIWDLESGESQVLAEHGGVVYALVVLTDGSLASGSGDNTIRIWDLESGESEVLQGLGGTVSSLMVLEDGRLAAGTNDNTIRIFDLESSERQVLEGHTGSVLSLALLSDGRLASGSRDGTIRIWDPAQATTDPSVSTGAQVEDETSLISGAESRSQLEDTEFYADTPAQEDLLGGGRQVLANALAEKLSRVWRSLDPTRDRSFQVHLHGEWGSGKSTLLNLLAEAIQPSDDAGKKEVQQQDPRDKDLEPEELRWIIVRFNAWQHQHMTPVWWPLLDQVFRQSKRQLRSYFKRRMKGILVWLATWYWRLANGGQLRNIIAFILAVIVAVLLVPVLWNIDVGQDSTRLQTIVDTLTAVLTIISFAVTLWTGARLITRSIIVASAGSAESFLNVSQDPFERIRKHFADLLKIIHHPVIVFIDDLDRCKQSYVVSLLETLNNLFSNARIFYIVAADRDWLYSSFEFEYKELRGDIEEPGRRLGYLFLQKSFQFSFKVPAINPALVEEYLNALSSSSEAVLVEQIEQIDLQARQVFSEATTEEEVFEKLEVAISEIKPETGGIEEQVYRAAAVRQRAQREVEASTELYLQQFAHLLEPNPRAIKRLYNAYGMYGSIAVLSGVDLNTRNEREQFVRWVILFLRWPYLADYLEGQPDDVERFLEDEDADPELEIQAPVTNEELLQTLLIQQLSGQRKDPQLPGNLSGLIGDKTLLSVLEDVDGKQVITPAVVRRYKGIAGL